MGINSGILQARPRAAHPDGDHRVRCRVPQRDLRAAGQEPERIEGLAISQANFLVSRIGQYFIYAVFIFGVLLVVLSDDVWDFSDSWIVGAIVLYVLGLGLSHGLQQPNVRRMIALQDELVRDGPAARRRHRRRAAMAGHRARGRGRRARIVGTVLQLNLVLILMLMVWGPRF